MLIQISTYYIQIPISKSIFLSDQNRPHINIENKGQSTFRLVCFIKKKDIKADIKL